MCRRDVSDHEIEGTTEATKAAASGRLTFRDASILIAPRVLAFDGFILVRGGYALGRVGAEHHCCAAAPPGAARRDSVKPN
jgi:hypothetical protein